MKILVTGTEGYLGCLLAPELIRDGHEVVGVDTGFYKNGWLYNGLPTTPLTLAKDIRSLTVEDLAGVEAIVHMAELSNDPLGQLSPTITYEINHQGSVHLATLAKQAGVERFVYMSSCSVYGVADGELTVHKHEGFWMGMDTFRDWTELNGLWDAGSPPWRVWED